MSKGIELPLLYGREIFDIDKIKEMYNKLDKEAKDNDEIGPDDKLANFELMGSKSEKESMFIYNFALCSTIRSRIHRLKKKLTDETVPELTTVVEQKDPYIGCVVQARTSEDEKDKFSNIRTECKDVIKYPGEYQTCLRKKIEEKGLEILI